jgi:hypothetical protein
MNQGVDHAYEMEPDNSVNSRNINSDLAETGGVLHRNLLDSDRDYGIDGRQVLDRKSRLRKRELYDVALAGIGFSDRRGIRVRGRQFANQRAPKAGHQPTPN